MFRRGTFSSGNIHYRINIDKSMCPNPVDIYLTGLILIYITEITDPDQVMSLNPRERAGSHPSGHPPPSLRLPLFLASFWFYPQNFISLGQDYNYV